MKLAEKEFVKTVVFDKLANTEETGMNYNHLIIEDWCQEVTATSIKFNIRLVSNDMRETLKIGKVIIKDNFASINNKSVKVSLTGKNKNIDKLINSFIGVNAKQLL